MLINQKTTLESLDGITKTLSNKLAKVDLVSVADYLNVKKYVLTEELELNDKEISSISDAVNSFIEITHNKEEAEEVVESAEEGIDLDSTDSEQSIEEVEDNSEEVKPTDQEPAEEVVESTEQEGSDTKIEEKEE